MPQSSDERFDVGRLPGRSGTFFVLASGGVLLVFLLFILVVSPRLQDQLGLNQGLGFDPPDGEPVRVDLTLGGTFMGVAVWDARGVCAEITDVTATTYRTCAVPDPLRPIWAIDAPDGADPAYVLVATPPQVQSLSGTTTAGEALNAMTQARELPAAWALIPLPDGASVDELVAFNTESADLGNVLCGEPDAPSEGPDRLQGGCLVPEQD